jgi:hypothetical protein
LLQQDELARPGQFASCPDRPEVASDLPLLPPDVSRVQAGGKWIAWILFAAVCLCLKQYHNSASILREIRQLHRDLQQLS